MFCTAVNSSCICFPYQTMIFLMAGTFDFCIKELFSSTSSSWSIMASWNCPLQEGNTWHSNMWESGEDKQIFLSGEIPHYYPKPERKKSSKQKWDKTIIWSMLLEKRQKIPQTFRFSFYVLFITNIIQCLHSLYLLKSLRESRFISSTALHIPFI